MSYTYLEQVLSDYLGYLKATENSQFNLADVQLIASDRWSWFVANWESRFYPNFKRILPKSEYFNNLLKDLNNEVITQKLFPDTNANPFLNLVKFIKYKPILSYIELTEISLTQSELIILKEEQKRLRNLSIVDFKDMSYFLRNTASLAFQTIGLGDEDGVLVQGFTLTEAQRGYSTEDLDQINDVFELADEIDGIIFYLQQKTEQNPNLLAVANRNIDIDSPVVFNQTYTSAISYPFVDSLEYMSDFYLNSKDRWFEIATINNLQPPYVDKTGEKEYLLGPGTLSSVKISSNKSNYLKIGTKVKIGSYTVRDEARSVLKIVKLDDGTMILSLSGEPDLAKLKVSEKAYIKIYKPQTVNEDSLLLIPVDAASPLIQGKQPSLDVLKKLDKSFLNFGIDIRRDEKTGELLVAKNGDFDIIYGMPAVRQALFAMLSTNTNELPFHPEYGIPLAAVIGSRFYGSIGFVAAFSEILRDIILSDSRYSSVVIQELAATETTVSINLIVAINDSDVIIPLSFVSS